MIPLNSPGLLKFEESQKRSRRAWIDWEDLPRRSAAKGEWGRGCWESIVADEAISQFWGRRISETGSVGWSSSYNSLIYIVPVQLTVSFSDTGDGELRFELFEMNLDFIVGFMTIMNGSIRIDWEIKFKNLKSFEAKKKKKKRRSWMKT